MINEAFAYQNFNLSCAFISVLVLPRISESEPSLITFLLL